VVHTNPMQGRLRLFWLRTFLDRSDEKIEGLL
jgi:hypothetical protein